MSSRKAHPVLLSLITIPVAFAVGFLIIGPRMAASQRNNPPVADETPAVSNVQSAGDSDSETTRLPRKPVVRVTVRSASPAVETAPVSPREESQVETVSMDQPEHAVTEAAAVESSSPEQPAPQKELYRVRVGAFSTVEAAQTTSRKLQDAGYACTIQSIERDGKILHSVQAGAFSAAEGAENTAKDLRDKGFDVYVAPPR